jgi:hypothetical protein
LIGTEVRVQAEGREATGDGRALVSFGHSLFCLLLCNIDQKKNMTRCAETGEEEWTRDRARNTGGSSESTKYCGGCCDLRRAIPAAWGHDLEREEGGRGEETRGYL